MHTTVLLEEAVSHLLQREDGYYVDGTFGRGGHSKAILERLNQQGRLLVIDKDPEALKVAQSIAATDKRVRVEQGGFSQIDKFVALHDLRGEGVQGILLDLGVSSPQLDQADRGFSFLRDGPLDMRMDTTCGETAAQWLAHADAQEIAQVLKRYGEERFAKRIAHAIVAFRQHTVLETTLQLAHLIEEAVPKKDMYKHPATRSFQAIRIYINQELQELESLLEKAIDVLAVGGRLVVISFHSLEDRIVKQFIREQERGPKVPSYIPVKQEDLWQPKLKSVGKAIKPTEDEIQRNARSRSAVMRIAERMS